MACPVVGMTVLEQSRKRTGDGFTWTGGRLFKSVTFVVLQEHPESTWNLRRLGDDGSAVGGLRAKSTKIPFGEYDTWNTSFVMK